MNTLLLPRIVIGLCLAVSIAGLSFAADLGATPPTADREYADDLVDHLAELRGELAEIEFEIKRNDQERAVAVRVIELASADVEKADDKREARRILRVVKQYRERLKRIELDRAQLEEHRARLTEAMARMEPLHETAESERAAQDAVDTAQKRDERIDALTARLENLRERADDKMGRGNSARERQMAINQIEALQLALPALREVDRHEAAERVQMAIRVREMTLERRDDDVARDLRKNAPDPEELRELLGLAAEWWQAQGHEGRAETIARMTEAIWTHEGRREKAGGSERAVIDRIERLQKHLEEVHAMVETMYEELADVKRTVIDGK